MKPELIIEQATPDDSEVILCLQKTAFLSEAALHNEFSIPPLHQSLESMYEDFQQGLILKATFGNQLVGSVRGYADQDTCYIGKLMVKATFENRGIGKKLMEQLENHYENVTRFELFTGNKSLKNLDFYQKLGYCPFKAKTFSKNLILIFMEKSNTVLN